MSIPQIIEHWVNKLRAGRQWREQRRDNGILINSNLFCCRLQFDGRIGDWIVVSVMEIPKTAGGIVDDSSSVGIPAEGKIGHRC